MAVARSQRPSRPVALVTGASGGLGQAIALELDRLGCSVALHCNSSQDAVRTLQGKLANDSTVVRADVTSWSEVSALFDEVTTGLGTVDVLVNAAGIRRDGLMATQAPERWRQVIETNLMGTFHTCRVGLAGMLKRRWGRIVNVVSPSGLIASRGQTAYSASKAGVIGLTRSLAAECGRRNVTVNALSPGFMDTAMTADISDRVRTLIMTKLLVPRFTTPEEVARSMGFFLDSDYVTGEVVSIDGGVAVT